jgi:hypothetical protein
MTRYSRLVRECAWKLPGCQRLLGVSVPTAPGNTGVTHTVCEACLDKMKGEHHARS